ncbi:hypothetical protein PUNSTDRAFT_137863 [Punctularia strigosozonata HHB-11173 SS5]|uniref:Uncharacterized protein n=1 Tax=Punctularia strigosozonata (strain HHB-11173) TaxID=741275 RepID=R7S5G0_PUNST|nr:uncharacterized protein PUNSTDRAFT_137863 [Punctularia strigosozonata HHB-11173 SS5]EIN05182.1 hypothetical protein PUNSTDRAFT_137863 [Punctularia strigosozonata HHB-11173 SS5]
MPQTHHYIRIDVSPPTSDALALRKLIQDAAASTSGLVHSSHVDVLWVADSGDHAVLRTNPLEAQQIMAAIALTPLSQNASSTRLSVAKDSPFLPSLLVTGTDL